jgi:GNAT superfamily N-acetyltransferase
MADAVYVASNAGDYEAFAELVSGYVAWCRSRYADLEWVMEQIFGHQSLDGELAVLPMTYGPPIGKTLLARSGGQIGGCGAFRKLSDGSCEMKRLFVPDQFRGRGLGRRLCEALISSARDDGYELMKLDTGNRLTEAISMYQSMGFMACAPYQQYPSHLMPYIVFMELPITPSGRRPRLHA